tara:strand:- start:120740 stop:121612 length:873 start_codon:yes stop_codon:yes gene_type:complete
MPSKWQQIHILCSESQADSLNDFLESHNTYAITLKDAADDPIFEPQPGQTLQWQHMQMTVLFDYEENLEPITKKLQQLELPYTLETLADEVWERKWMDDFQPMQFGDDTWIIPSWHKAANDDAVNIILDPGLAFGTGTHPTTALCLTWLDQHDCQNKTVIDYGCGSGILAIAALKHGATHVDAIDHDEQALQATQDNAERNAIDLTTLDVYLPKDEPKNTADLLIANILAQPLIDLCEHFAGLLNPDGQIILSGILDTQVDAVVEAYQKHFEIVEIKQQDEWMLVSAIKR